MSRPELQPVSADDASLVKLVRLFRATWPNQHHLDLAYLRWLYRDNPCGAAIGINAWDAGEAVGHYSVIPIRVRYRGASVSAALSLNTAVHPSHQGRGLFTALAGETYVLAAGRGIDHVVGVANANSIHGFIKKLGFQLVQPLRARFVTGFPRKDKIPAGWERDWDPASYHWRLSNPKGRYRWSQVGGQTVWWSATGVPGISAAMQYSASSPFDTAIQTALTRCGWVPLKLWIGLEPGETPRGIELPGFLRRSPLNLIFKSLRGVDELDPHDTRVTLADFDAY